MGAPSSERELVEVLAEEFARRYRRGERPALTEYTDRYPDLADDIRELFPALVLMEQFGSVAGPTTGPDLSAVADAAGRPQQLGEYRLLREVGRGGMGVVYEAEQVSLGRHVALKVLPFHGLLAATHLERFRREAKAAARLHHTNVVPVFAVGEHEGVHYYAMQFIHGQGLDVVLRELKQMRGPRLGSGEPRPAHSGDGGLSAGIAQGLLTGCFRRGEPDDGPPTPAGQPGAAPEAPETLSGPSPTSQSGLAGQSEARFYRSVARVGIQVAEALAYAHEQGVLHRDVKPSNLLLDTRGCVWVTDFGLAKAEGSDELTRPGDVVGTVRYMAPERFQGQADPRSDVYGLGMTLYELLTLRPAFDDSNRARLIARVGHEEPPRPRQIDPRIPRDLETIILKAIAKQPADRYPDAQALAEDLRRFLADRPIRARRSSGTERAWRWCRRNPAMAGLIAAVACSLLAGTAVSIGFALAAREKAEQEAGARAEAETHLYHSLVGEARALRLARENGYRIKAWDRLKRARELETPGRDLDELRREAVACLGDSVGLMEPRIWDVPGIGKAGGPRLALHPDGVQLALGLGDGGLLLRNLATGEDVVLRQHCVDVSAVAFTPDGKRLVTGDVRGHLLVWEPDPAGRWAPARSLCSDPPLELPPWGTELALAVSPDGRRVAACPARARSVVIWDLADGGVTAHLHGPHEDNLRGAAWSPDGRYLAVAYNYSGEGQRGILLWDMLERHWLPRRPLNLGHIFALAFSPDGRWFAAGCIEGFMVFAMPDFRHHLTIHRDQVRSLTFSPDGDRLFLISETLGAVRMWDVVARRPTGTLQHPGMPFLVTVSPDGKTLVAASHKSVRFWTLCEPVERRALAGHPGVGVPGLAFSPDGRLLASAGKDRTVKVWNVATGRLDRELTKVQGEAQAVAFTPDSLTLAATDFHYGLTLWDVPTWQARRVPDHGLNDLLWAVAFSPDGAWLAAGGKDGLRLWRTQRPAAGEAAPGLLLEPRERLVVGQEVTALCFSPDSRHLAWLTNRNADGGYRISCCDLPDGRPRLLSAGAANLVLSLAFTPDSRHLTFVNEQDVWEVWDVVRDQSAPGWKGRESVGGNIALSADGAWLASGGPRSVTVWDTARQELLLALPHEFGSVWALAWSPDRELLAVSSSDGGPVIWNIPRVREQLREINLDWVD